MILIILITITNHEVTNFLVKFSNFKKKSCFLNTKVEIYILPSNHALILLITFDFPSPQESFSPIDEVHEEEMPL